MDWFGKLCRSTGLMIHHVIRPRARKQELRHETQQKTMNNVTLRRTTIEEIEVRPDSKDQ